MSSLDLTSSVLLSDSPPTYDDVSDAVKSHSKHERGLTMAWHSVLIGLVAYVLMVVFGQDSAKAENNSLVIGSLALIYMIIYGHDLPPALQKKD